jgi:hypothetical protein
MAQQSYLSGGQQIASALKIKEIKLPNRSHRNGADTEIGSGALWVVEGEPTEAGMV